MLYRQLYPIKRIKHLNETENNFFNKKSRFCLNSKYIKEKIVLTFQLEYLSDYTWKEIMYKHFLNNSIKCSDSV